MIEIKFKPKTMMVKVTGHAGQAEKGQDIVCSAVSILFYTLAQAVTTSRDALEDEPLIIINDGEISFGKKNIRQMLELIHKG